MQESAVDGIASETSSLESPTVSAGYLRYALWLLMLVYVVNFIDRTIIYILIEPIKIELKLLDWQLGLLSGLAFGLVYTLLTFPLAIVADRKPRPMIIAASLAVWSVFTLLCGAAQNFFQLVLARAGVGVGEAGCVPAAHALIADYTPPSKRASALAFFAIGGPIGGLLGLALGGLISEYYGWRMAFILAGLPGLVLAVLVATTLREPRNFVSVSARKQRVAAASFADTFRYLKTKRAFWFMGAAGSVRAFISYGHGAFLASFFYRVHPEQLEQAATWFGTRPQVFVGFALAVTTGIVAVVATWMGGQIADRIGARDLRIYARMPAIASLALLPFAIASFLVDDLTSALVLTCIAQFLSAVWGGPVYASAQGMVPPHMRATSSAIMIFMLNFVALVFGAMIVGAISDLLASYGGLGPAEGMRWALILTISASAIAVPLFWAAGRTIREDIES
jgi:MFS family permease